MSSGKDERYAIALILRIKAAETSVHSALTVYRCRMFQSSVLIKHSDRVFRSNVLSIDAVVLIKRSNPTLVSDVCILRILDTFHRLFIAALINHWKFYTKLHTTPFYDRAFIYFFVAGLLNPFKNSFGYATQNSPLWILVQSFGFDYVMRTSWI